MFPRCSSAWTVTAYVACMPMARLKLGRWCWLCLSRWACQPPHSARVRRSQKGSRGRAQVLAGSTSAWRSVEDADMFLDALVLSYEVAVHGDRSPWADYLCLLPRSYDGLPVHIRNTA
ncbi:hypothetical protein Vretimale_8577 [Volvox reticuliferus]|uniref:Uncharacterized protein n=1 Tax=Volvox reticuliferus TaxID=1737510 RepID=A0A8J4LNE5_9CHLO|nr:hypothetical protein Vretimale_8577 [Volvox reticuliferus]